MNIRVVTRVPLSGVVQELVELRLGRALRRWGQRVEQAAVTFEDQNRPGGGAGTLCRVWLRLHPRGEVNVSAVAASLGMALSAATMRAGRCIESSVRASWTERRQPA